MPMKVNNGRWDGVWCAHMWCTNPWNEGTATRASVLGYCVGQHSGMGVAIQGRWVLQCKYLEQCRWDNGPICEPPTETKLTARACFYHHPEICYEFDMQKLSIPFRVWLPIQPLTHPSGSND